MIANASKDKKSALDAWGNSCDLKIGRHTFGYDKSQDGYKLKSKPSSNPMTYVVKAGDTLQKIAKRFNTTVDEIAAKNHVKDPNKIAIGQKLRV